jgi:hypothetical protein
MGIRCQGKMIATWGCALLRVVMDIAHRLLAHTIKEPGRRSVLEFSDRLLYTLKFMCAGLVFTFSANYFAGVLELGSQVLGKLEQLDTFGFHGRCDL